MANIKRVLVCFNSENKSQNDLFEMLIQEFGVNMSGGIRSILWSYFNGTLTRPQPTTHIANEQNTPSIQSVL